MYQPGATGVNARRPPKSTACPCSEGFPTVPPRFFPFPPPPPPRPRLRPRPPPATPSAALHSRRRRHQRDHRARPQQQRQRGMTAAHPHDQLPRMLHHPTGKVDQRKPDRLQALAHPLVSQHQPLHRGIQVERKHRDPPPRRILPKRPTGKLPPGQVLLENPVHLLALPATPPVPPDQFLPGKIPVRHDPEHLVRAAPHLHRLEGKIPLRLQIRQPQLNREPLPDRQKPVRRILLAVPRKPRNEADLRKFLVRLLAPATPLAEQRPPRRFLHLRDRLFELQRHRRHHRKTDHPEPLVRPLGAITQQILSISGCIAAEKHTLHAFRKTRKGLLQNPKQIVVRRNVPVTKLSVRHNPLLRPVHRQR